MKHTAVEWLYLQSANKKLDLFDLLEAKGMEKEQIVDAWNGGDYAYFYSKETGRDFADGEEYYKETYKGGQDE